MASPPDNSSILNGSISSSPRQIRSDQSPVRHRQSSGSEINEPPSRPRLSPTLSRSYNPHDPDARERQRTMDADMAMQLSRARSGTIVMPSPITPPPLSPIARRASIDEPRFPALSLQEQQAIDEARGAPQLQVDVERPEQYQHPGPTPGDELLNNHLSAGHDPALLVSLDVPYHDDAAMGGLPMYQATVERTDGPHYEFSLMEDFARDEKTRLGIRSPTSPPRFDFRQAQASSSTHVPIPSSSEQPLQPDGPPEGGVPASQDSSLPFTFPRVRQRKLSSSSPGPRRGKMALFEQGGPPPPTLGSRAPHLGGMGTTLSAVPSYDNVGDALRSGPDGMGLGGGGPGSGHDRPYRFSFYSNALSATIHARSLGELPAEGQSFEDLFLGHKESQQPSNATSARASFLNHPAGGLGSVPKSGATSPVPVPNAGGATSGLAKTLQPERRLGESSASESYTWWLDVLAPTDDEMKLLSKVRVIFGVVSVYRINALEQVFSIHPLTTEDIQMEETREKIELFRNYYLVCFRGFDQDTYSPTYLEPLNMYIIVFRDGILSVSGVCSGFADPLLIAMLQFHFRPTPHPQNVRRRIKQLKDYISVTSDWISYALIDDITDAFGPLIQGIEYEVDSIDELVLILKEAEQSDMLRRSANVQMS